MAAHVPLTASISFKHVIVDGTQMTNAREVQRLDSGLSVLDLYGSAYTVVLVINLTKQE